MQYNFKDIEKKWQRIWKVEEAYRVKNNSGKPKCYVLDMFPYPSGAGLHVGHPLGYIAGDIYARYKRLQGYNVLHPMGFDAFGLPAEQYAIETGQHPAVTTEKNIARYKEQLNNIGFCFDWSREVKTSDPGYYKWTQWIFLQLYQSWYNPERNKTEPISSIVNSISQSAFLSKLYGDKFGNWDEKSFAEQEKTLMEFRLAYRAESYVNWCEALGTVLANDEVVNGVSERGGHPVERRLMSQWFLRITAYAERLLEGLEKVDFPESLKEMQKNWIGKSVGAEIEWELSSRQSAVDGRQSTVVSGQYTIKVFTTRPDTIFGVSFMVLAPEHLWVREITTAAKQNEVEDYIKYVSSRSERERMAETKKISGVFTGAYAIHPFTKSEIPIWISEYVLAGYGTGAIMAVPCGDERDYAFAKHFHLPIPNIFKDIDISEAACTQKNVLISNSDFLNDLNATDAARKVIEVLQEFKTGERKINYRMRDAGFSRQRYWGEPFPIVYDQNNITYPLPESELPLELPYLESYTSGPNGKGPLANAKEWVYPGATPVNEPYHVRETDTMPGYAGSSWYYLRYMDPHNNQVFCDRTISDYWNQVDVYIGGAEHAVGHLLYSRMWCKALYDLGHIGFEEPYKKLINQGMIQGSSRFVYKYLWPESGQTESKTEQLPPVIISRAIGEKLLAKDSEEEISLRKKLQEILKKNDLLPEINTYDIKLYAVHVDVNIVDGFELDIEAFKKWKPEYGHAEFIDENGKIFCFDAVEKMSKSKYNVVNPDDIIAQYGADTFRMYEMFLGPLELSKPWDTKGIEGVHRFLKKLWRLFYSEEKGFLIVDETPVKEELRILHKTIKKIQHDTENFAFNTAVSQFMIAVNELSALDCHKLKILQPLLILLSPYAPHICEELWKATGQTTGILDAPFPLTDESILVENSFLYPVAIQGKARTGMEFDLNLSTEEIQTKVLQNEIVQKWMGGKPLKKLIFVKGKMINIVI